MALKIGLSSNTIEPTISNGRYDGIGHYTKVIHDKLINSGHEVTNYCFQKTFKRNQSFKISKKFPHSSLISIFLSVIGNGRLFKNKIPADIFHFTDHLIIPTTCPSVATIHDIIPIEKPEWTSKKTRFLWPMVIKSGANSVDHIITDSEYSALMIHKKLKIPTNKISVIYLSVDQNWLKPLNPVVTKTLLNKFELQPGYILFVGTIQPRKNVDSIITAYNKLPDKIKNERQLVLIGKYGWESKQLIETIIANKNITWLDQIADDDDLKHLYSAASMFVFPSLYEGFGLPLLEAFASKVPAITSNTTSLPEISAGAAIEVDPLNIDQLTGAMEALATNSSLRERHIKLGLKRLKDFSWDKTLKETLAVYDKVLNG